MPRPGYDAKVMKPREYADGWSRMMVTIWKEKIEEYMIYDSGDLLHSLNASMDRWTDDKDKGAIVHTFLQYGIYVERGTGREKNYGNSGDIGEFQQSGEERLFRIPKPWMRNKYLYSMFRLGDYFAANYGNQFCAIIKDTLERKAD